jgi:hypothetical protein
MKQPVIYYILGFLGAFFLELRETLLSIGFLIIADSLTGVWYAWKEGTRIEGSIWKGWKHVTSRKAARILIKLFIYPLVLIVAKVGEDYLTPAIPWISVTSGILAVIEIKSIFENAGNILGYNVWKKVAEKLWPDKNKDEREPEQ